MLGIPFPPDGGNGMVGAAGDMEEEAKSVPAAHNLSNPRRAKRNVKRSLGTERHATATRGTLTGG